MQWVDTPTIEALNRFFSGPEFRTANITLVLSARRDELEAVGVHVVLDDDLHTQVGVVTHRHAEQRKQDAVERLADEADDVEVSQAIQPEQGKEKPAAEDGKRNRRYALRHEMLRAVLRCPQTQHAAQWRSQAHSAHTQTAAVNTTATANTNHAVARLWQAHGRPP